MSWMSGKVGVKVGAKQVLVGVTTVFAAAVIAVPFIGTSSTTAGQAAFAADATKGTGITTDGLGKVYGTPDTLNLNMSVSVIRSDVSAAFNAANDQLDKVISSLKAHGVDQKYIQTAGLNINPMYTNGDHPTISGYQVDNSLTAIIHNLKTAGSVVTAAVKAGGNAVRVNGLSVSLDDDPALIRSARERAFADAKDKAEQYAQLSGRQLGKPLSIVESVQGSVMPQAVYAGAVSGAPAAKDLAIQGGQQAVNVAVTVVWEFA